MGEQNRAPLPVSLPLNAAGLLLAELLIEAAVTTHKAQQQALDGQLVQK
jgi:hypothetical protein